MRRKSLCEISNPKQWKTISTDKLKDEGYPVYGANGIIGYYSEYNHEASTLLITCRGATCGSLNICKPYSYVTGNAMALDSLSKEVDIHYLYYYLLNRGLKDTITGTAQPQIVRQSLQKVVIEYPELALQLGVVQKLQSVDVLIDKRKQQLSKLDELIKARFVEMFGGINDSKIYPYKAVKELTDVISGGTPSREVNEYWEDGNIPWVKTTELHNNVITEIDEHITKSGLDNSSAKLVPAGTILIAMYGQGKTRGMTGYLGVEACTNQACACILPTGNINQKYLWQYFVLSYDNLRDMAKGGNQPNLNGNIIKNYAVLYPPIELQNQFAAFVEQVDKSKAEIQKSLDKLEILKKSLMQKYFG